MKLLVASPFEAVSGKVGGLSGIVAYRSRGVQYARNMVTPTNPDTSQQQVIRNYLSLAATAWKSVTDAEESAWAALAAQIIRTNPLGADYTPYPNNVYEMVNFYRQLNGQAITDTAPSYASPAAAGSISNLEFAGGQLDIEVTHGLTPASGFFVVRVTPNLGSARRQARGNELRYADGTLSDNIVAIAASAQVIQLDNLNFSLNVGDWIGIQVLTVTNDYLPGGVLFDTNEIIVAP